MPFFIIETWLSVTNKCLFSTKYLLSATDKGLFVTSKSFFLIENKESKTEKALSTFDYLYINLIEYSSKVRCFLIN